MKNVFTRILGLIITVAIVLGVRAIVSNVNNKVDEIKDKKYSANIEGSWESYDENTTDTKTKLLKNIDLTDEEIEIVKYIKSYCVSKYDFNEDGTYSEYYDRDKTFDEADKFFDEVFETLYENRSKINDYYMQKFNLNLNNMTLTEFLDAMAKLYDVENYNELPQHLIKSAYKEDAYQEVKNGTYTVDENRITFGNNTYVTYNMPDDNTLVLNYTNMVITLKRVN